MPIYFFDVHLADQIIEDDTIGAEFPDNQHARREAERALGEMAADVARNPKAEQVKVTVRNALGQVVGIRAAMFNFKDFDPA